MCDGTDKKAGQGKNKPLIPISFSCDSEWWWAAKAILGLKAKSTRVELRREELFFFFLPLHCQFLLLL